MLQRIRTKIIATIGPASKTEVMLRRLVRAGMDAARLNFSHGTYAEHGRFIRLIRKVSRAQGKPIAILQDLQGPRLRLGQLAVSSYQLAVGHSITLVEEKRYHDQPGVLPTQHDLSGMLRKGNTVLINDGLVELKVLSAASGAVHCRVVKGGTVSSHKGINLPGVRFCGSVFTQKDRADLAFGLAQGVDFVAMSFVRQAADVRLLRRLIGHHPAQIIAKIERPEAVEQFNGILAVADAVMVARGDLGIELPAERVPLIQKNLLARTRGAGKPVIVATQMLESMTQSSRPTRAEVSDVANAVIDHADALMLSAESASGKYPVESVAMMARIIGQTETSRYDDLPLGRVGHVSSKLRESVARSACQVAQDSAAAGIVAVTRSGATARLISRYRLEIPLVAITDDQAVQRQLQIAWGVRAFLLPNYRSLDSLVVAIRRLLRRERIAKAGQTFVLATPQPLNRGKEINVIKVLTV